MDTALNGALLAALIGDSRDRAALTRDLDVVGGCDLALPAGCTADFTAELALRPLIQPDLYAVPRQEEGQTSNLSRMEK
ncbi:hypothetical protein NDU88_011575 [Pleurodeles waltl]|uniref:Uncharacterized protein n=1 Tax=Pleurodeles waltl TaxID=8319 RepID=A0AAV7QZI0_PLEWA|nr:hypothetical protein NDU88_011575 [Pleurodeles waltl]